MKLVIKNAKLSKDHFPHVEVTIVGKPEESSLIENIDNLIGQETSGFGDRNWRQMYSTDCAEYEEGVGVTWIFDKDDLDEFKELYAKHKEPMKKGK